VKPTLLAAPEELFVGVFRCAAPHCLFGVYFRHARQVLFYVNVDIFKKTEIAYSLFLLIWSLTPKRNHKLPGRVTHTTAHVSDTEDLGKLKRGHTMAPNAGGVS